MDLCTGKKRKKPQRASKLTPLQMLSDKYQQKAELKEKELNLRRMELEFEKEYNAEAEERKKYNAEAEERKAKLQLELEERRAYLALLQKHPSF